MIKNNQAIDCVIIGGGPAGLTAAIYLARFRRNFCLIDNNQSRAKLIPLSHNYPGFPEGVPGKVLLKRLQQQIKHYDVNIITDFVKRLKLMSNGIFQIQTENTTLKARTVLLATGATDIKPQDPKIIKAIEKGLIRLCPICDAYEVCDKKIFLIGHTDHTAKEALFMQTYTDKIALLTIGMPLSISNHLQRRLRKTNITIFTDAITKINFSNKKIILPNSQHDFNCIYIALGQAVNSTLATNMGAKEKNGFLIVNAKQATHLPGLYAAGDVVKGLSQISVATGQAAIAATAIHNYLDRAKKLNVKYYND